MACTDGLACSYSKAMDQVFPRKCTICSKPEPHRVIGGIAHSVAHTLPNAAATLDEMFGDAVITNEGNVELTSGMVQLTGSKAEAWTEYNAATIALRDGELAYRAAQERYRKALERLNESIAKAGA